MIIVHPHDVVGPQQCFKMSGEILIDPEITTEVATGEFGEIKPIVQNRPQHSIGEAVVEFLVVVLAEVDGGVGNIVVRDRFDRPRPVFSNAPAPAEPEAAMPLKRRSDRHLEPTGPRAAIRNRNSVRHYDEPRQYRSPQLRDSLIAVKINPDIEYVCGKFPHNFPVTGCTSSDRRP